MDAHFALPGEFTNFALPGELTIYTAADTRAALLDWLARAPAPMPLQLSADQVFEVDAAGVQLLCSLGALLAREGRSWCISRSTSTLQQACTQLGLGPWLAPLLCLDDAGPPDPANSSAAPALSAA